MSLFDREHTGYRVHSSTLLFSTYGDRERGIGNWELGIGNTEMGRWGRWGAGKNRGSHGVKSNLSKVRRPRKVYLYIIRDAHVTPKLNLETNSRLSNNSMISILYNRRHYQ